MPALERQIRQMRVRCARDEHALHGRVLLEDALRTATLRDESRLVFVRRLDLGKLPLRASSTEWSLRLEHCYREPPLRPVHYNHPSAANANAVWFEDALEPWLAAAERFASKRPCHEWFWPRALPSWSPHMEYAQALALGFRRIATLGGFAATVALARRLEAAGAIASLLRALGPDDLDSLHALLGTAEDIEPEPPATGSRETAYVLRAPALSEAERAWVSGLPPHDLRLRWLAAVRLSPASPRIGHRLSALVPPPQPEKIDATLRAWRRSSDSNVASDGSETPAAGLHARQPEPATHAETKTDPFDTANDRPPETPSPPPVRLFTQGGGLFFLVPLLQRAGLPEHAARLPAAEADAFPWQVLRLALRHARIADDDTLALAFEEFPETETPLGCWLISANRSALKLTGLNLRQLVRRTAEITLTPTHVDLFFRATDADIRIRRAGLDLDPGWVPWLGRIVRYHFNRED